MAQRLTPVKAIREYCLSLCAGRPSLVRKCQRRILCSLYPYRMGQNPNRRGIGTLKSLLRSKNPHSTKVFEKENWDEYQSTCGEKKSLRTQIWAYYRNCQEFGIGNTNKRVGDITENGRALVVSGFRLIRGCSAWLWEARPPREKGSKNARFARETGEYGGVSWSAVLPVRNCRSIERTWWRRTEQNDVKHASRSQIRKKRTCHIDRMLT